MTAIAVPRRRALDARLVVGVALVAASVGGVAAVINAMDTRVAVYAVTGAVAPGERITSADIAPREVALDGAEALYIGVGQLPDDGLVATRALRPGELLAISAVGSSLALDSTSLVLDLVTPLSASTAAGDPVDLWSARPAEAGWAEAPPAPPSVLVSDAVFVGDVSGDSLIGGGGRTRVEVLIPRDRVALVLEAVASGASLAAVPAGLPWAPQ